VDGVLVVDKPRGITSHDVVSVARRLLQEPRIGHAGTLDPLATGVLVLACGRATRLVRFLSASDKTYDATIVFGFATDTYDVTGAETFRTDASPTRAALDAALSSLCGSYLQEPPAFSAKKVAGRRAYELARRQKPVALAAVPVHVGRASLESFDGARAVVTLSCSAGFYVRSFAHALGERLGTGACLQSLRRMRSGEFAVEDAVTLEQLHEHAAASTTAWPMERLLTSFPAVQLTAEGLVRVAHGREIDPRHLTSVGSPQAVAGADADWVRLLGPDGRLVAVADRGPGSTLHPSIVLI
jgi:tRNA pseudouridine55 synthase